jgi:hypothetical protein
MSKNFEQLIEFVINDEEDKARELFHDIVVAKSRQIYEEMMEAEEVMDAEEDDEEEVTEADESAEEDDEEEEVEESFGGDSADDLIDDVEMEEEGMSMEAEGDDAGDSDVENKLMDIEDKLDELMSEFEALMSGEGDEPEHDDMGDDMGMDDMGDEDTLDVEIDGEDDMGDEEEVEFSDEEEGMMEAISLKAAPKPTTSEEGSINKKAVYAANSGAAGMASKPVHATGTEAKGRPAPTTKDLISDVQNAPARSSVKLSPATKPHLAQATGVNTKSPVGKA